MADSNPVVSRLKFWFGPLATSQLWLKTSHLLLDLPVGLIGLYFARFISAVATGNNTFAGGIIIALFGIPLIAGVVLMGRLFAALGRKRSQIFLKQSFPAPTKFNFNGSRWMKLLDALRDEAGWKGLLYAAISLPLGIINFAITLFLWIIAIPLSSTVIFIWFIPRGSPHVFIWDSLSVGRQRIINIINSALRHWHNMTNIETLGLGIGLTLIGVGLLIVIPRVINFLATIDRTLIRILCTPNPNSFLSKRVIELEESRSASVQGAASELRRIERDLHDGAQQHLVSVAMQLGMAKERLNEETDSEIAELITSAHRDAKQAIVELRDLVRGIHPSVLTDRGLDAAISALAGRCTVSVEVKNAIRERLPQSVEATAYFVIAESLTNISKHSQATHATLHLSKERNRIVIEVTDDGIGGAHDDTEGGLRGLRDRVRSIEGDMTISSPTNGPTRILVNLPCE